MNDRKPIRAASIFLWLSFSMGLLAQNVSPAGSPHLEVRGQAKQLIVDGKPMLMIAGELRNSSSSSLTYMSPEWKQLSAMGLNTVLTPISWELVEPQEGHFDFTLIDGLLEQARAEHMHIVFLWLAAWKNGLSGYAPVWVKSDTKRFPRAMHNGNIMPILSTFYPSLEQADARAFTAVMAHLRRLDVQHTVLMMQVENEVGILGDSRDRSPAADAAFSGPVPAELLQYFRTPKESLNSELLALWTDNGSKISGSWAEVFGSTARADEAFMAWNYARYVQAVATAGKAAYNIPMYANAWLASPGAKPGEYPSGGPQPRVLDIWKAAGDALDMESPDLYATDFSNWCQLYKRPDNPLFIPETNGGSAGAANAFYAFGERAALGFSPFGIDSGMHGDAWGGPAGEAAFAKGRLDLTQSYQALEMMAPEILRAQSAGEIHGFLLNKDQPFVDFTMGGIVVHVSLDEIFGHRIAETGFGLIIQESPQRYLATGRGFRVSFTPADPGAPRLGLGSVEEGRFANGRWVPGRRLNGDEDDQGQEWRFDPRDVHIERATLYELH